MTNLENLTRYYVDIVEITNKNCTRHEIKVLVHRFKRLVFDLNFMLPCTNILLTPQRPIAPLREKYDSPLTPKESRQLITAFDLLIECDTTDETNRFCDETEDFDYYTGTFTNKDRAVNKSLVIEGFVIDGMTEKIVSHVKHLLC